MTRFTAILMTLVALGCSPAHALFEISVYEGTAGEAIFEVAGLDLALAPVSDDIVEVAVIDGNLLGSPGDIFNSDSSDPTSFILNNSTGDVQPIEGVVLTVLGTGAVSLAVSLDDVISASVGDVFGFELEALFDGAFMYADMNPGTYNVSSPFGPGTFVITAPAGPMAIPAPFSLPLLGLGWMALIVLKNNRRGSSRG